MSNSRNIPNQNFHITHTTIQPMPVINVTIPRIAVNLSDCDPFPDDINPRVKQTIPKMMNEMVISFVN